MTKTEARLALAQRQRRFEWELARDEQARAAARFVAARVHDLLNLLQIVELATVRLDPLCGPPGKDVLAELQHAAGASKTELLAMMAATRAELPIARGAPIGPGVDAARAALRPAFDVEIQLATSRDTRTRCAPAELEHLLIGLALDVLDGAPPGAGGLELGVRERTVDGRRWLEIVRPTPHDPAGDRFELRAVTAIAHRAGGELARAERRGGLVVALPVV